MRRSQETNLSLGHVSGQPTHCDGGRQGDQTHDKVSYVSMFLDRGRVAQEVVKVIPHGARVI